MKQRRFMLMLYGTFLLQLVLVLYSPGQTAGSLCIAPVVKGEKSVPNVNAKVFAIQIDDRPAVAASSEHGTKVTDLPLEPKHLVKVTGDGKPVTSFRFRFSEYDTQDLCLWRNDLYGTWSLTESKSHSKICVCH